jgi:hypothetical protein
VPPVWSAIHSRPHAGSRFTRISPERPRAGGGLRTVREVRESVFDLRDFNLAPYQLGLVTAVLIAVAAFYGSTTVDTRTVAVVCMVIGGVAALIVLAGLTQLSALRRPRRLVIDHEGIRVDNGGRRPVRVAWTELDGVGLVVDDRRRRRQVRWRRRGESVIPPSLVGVTVMLELTPADEQALRRHPELARAWMLGGRRAWRIWLTSGPGDPLPIGRALQRHRPELWRGERSGPALFA